MAAAAAAAGWWRLIVGAVMLLMLFCSALPALALSTSTGGPYTARACARTTLGASAGTDDACGGQVVVLTWDFNGDGVFDDGTGPNPVFDASRFSLGTHTIYLKATPPCASDSSPPQVLSTTVFVDGGGFPSITGPIDIEPFSNNLYATVGEPVQVFEFPDILGCYPSTLTTDCGPGGTRVSDDYFGRDNCVYNEPGQKLITITLSNAGVTVSRMVNATIVPFVPVCTSTSYPSGRVLGHQGCRAVRWLQGFTPCRFPSSVKPTTFLWAAFASRAPEDAAVIRRYYGNITVSQALAYDSVPRQGQLRLLAAKATAALLNAEQLIYAQCPQQMKLTFRHALYHGPRSPEVSSALSAFGNQNGEGTEFVVCPLLACPR